jgi:hypothetical protein
VATALTGLSGSAVQRRSDMQIAIFANKMPSVSHGVTCSLVRCSCWVRLVS